MSSIGTGYDLQCDTYSPDGRVFQVEYAQKAVDKSGTVIGICCSDGVVVGVEKLKLSKMLVHGSNRCVYAIDKQAGLVTCGLHADGRQIVNRARSECADYRNSWGVPIKGETLSERIASFMHMYTLYYFCRPFGVSALLASYADDGPQLYMVDPSGTCVGFHACAVGKARQVAKTELEQLKLDTITCKEAVKAIATIIYKIHDDVKDKLFELEMGWVCDDSKQTFQPVPQDLLAEAEAEAKKAKEEEDQGEDDPAEAADTEMTE